MTVKLNDATAVTDSNGIANFLGVAAGKYTVLVESDKGNAKSTIEVVEGSSELVQEFQLQIKPQSPILMYGLIGGAVLAVLAVGAVVFSRISKRSKFNNAHGLGNTAVVFDTNKAPSPGVDKGAIVTPQKPVATAPASEETKGPEGNMITPEQPLKPPGTTS